VCLADSIFWTSLADSTIRGAPLAGGGKVDTLYGNAQGAQGPVGVAIDAAAGRIYWANQSDLIRGAPLEGGGTVDTLTFPGPGFPGGVAIDTAGWIYWANEDDWIQRVPLAGGGGRYPEKVYGPANGVKTPSGVAVDPAAGRIYWANNGDNTIRGAKVTSGAVDTLYRPTDGVKNPSGVAVDPAAGRIYWANNGDNTIRGGKLTGGGAVDTLYGPADGVSGPVGVAIDPPATAQIISINQESWLYPLSGGLSPAVRIINWLINHIGHGRNSGGRIYWTNQIYRGANQWDNTILGAPLEGGGTVDTLYSGSGGSVGPIVAGDDQWGSPKFLAVLRAPLGTGAPTISGRGLVLQPFFCSQGDWVADLPGSFLYRAPQSFAYQWMLNGSDIGGATLDAYTPEERGNYSCRVTATNQAGSTAQTSAAVAG